METVQIGSMAPLFLRFINMLISDATLQLDEGLQVQMNMSIAYVTIKSRT